MNLELGIVTFLKFYEIVITYLLKFRLIKVVALGIKTRQFNSSGNPYSYF